jgi:hypothetical protein
MKDLYTANSSLFFAFYKFFEILKQKFKLPNLFKISEIWIFLITQHNLGWIDELKVGKIKFPHAGHKSGLMCSTQMKN